MMRKIIALFAVLVMSLVILPTPTAYANPSPMVEVEILFKSNVGIYGLTALDTLGKPTGTMTEFSNAAVGDDITNYIMFPANFFNAYQPSREIFGGIYSQGRAVSDGWLNYGAGFDTDNRFHLFNFPGLLSNVRDGRINIRDDSGNDVAIVTAFNCHPWLIRNGVNLELIPTPYADTNFLNARAQRAFMGQRSDGTFVYGMVRNSTIHGLQAICAELGLVNAVNTDGGASASLFQNGRYLARPGRELASVVLIAERISDAPSSWAEDDVRMANQLNLVPDELNSLFTRPITRAEFCALAVLLHERVTGRIIAERMAFNDTNDVNVEKMGALGVVNGVGNNNFAPNATLTREQAAVILARLAAEIGKPFAEQPPEFADNASISRWAQVQVGQVQAAGIMGGVGNNNFNPEGSYTREQSILTMLRLYQTG